MTVLDIIVPFSLDTPTPELELCLAGIAASTSGQYQATLVPTKDCAPDGRVNEISEIVARACPSLPWRVVDYGHDSGVTAPVLRAILNAEGQYVAVVPTTHALADPNWFGKLQVPFMRTPQCGLAFAADAPELVASGAQPFLWSARTGSPGRVVLSIRETLTAIARSARLLDYPEALIWSAKSLGLVTWGVPGVRIDIADAPAPASPRSQPRNAHRPG